MIVKKSGGIYDERMKKIIANLPSIGIIGAGAMGLTFASHFINSGFSVQVYEKNLQIRKALRSGFQINQGMQSEHYTVTLLEELSLLQKVSLVFLFTKSAATERVADQLAQIVTPDQIVVTLQNGLGNYEKLKESGLPVVGGSTSVGAARQDERTVRIAGIGTTVVGGSERAHVERVYQCLKEAGFPVEQSDDIQKAIWKKAIINAAINPIAALLGVTNGELLRSPQLLQLQAGVISEAVAVARAEGITFHAEALQDEVATVCQTTATNLCSMLQDIRATRPTEIDAINGAIVRYGEKVGVPTPINRTLCQLITALSSG
jgi:2-dehydropantoate 2-reductase